MYEEEIIEMPLQQFKREQIRSVKTPGVPMIGCGDCIRALRIRRNALSLLRPTRAACGLRAAAIVIQVPYSWAKALK